MREHADPPDIRDWSTLPLRLRLGFVVEVTVFVGVGLLLGAQFVSLGFSAIVLASSLIVFVLVFDSRRAWWPEEPTVPYDPLAANGGRWILFGVVAIVVTLTLVGIGALH